MKTAYRMIFVATAAVMAVSAIAQGLVVPSGTTLTLAFDQGLNSRTAQVGQTVRMHVVGPVVVDGKTVIASGTRVTGVLSQVNHRKAFGVNARIRLALNPVKSVTGKMVPIEARTKGHYIGGEKSALAGGAAAGGAIVLGPVGLAGGYFVKGKRVIINPGDRLETEVSSTVRIR